MSLRDELKDPWTLLAAGVAAGAAWAVSDMVLAAVGVGAAVAGVKALTGMLSGRPAKPKQRRLPIRDRSPEAGWIRRAEKAMGSFEQLAGSVRPGPIADHCASMGERARTAIQAMYRLAGQASAVAGALARIDTERLRSDVDRLNRDLGNTPDDETRAVLEHTLEAVHAQADVRQRLVQAGRTLLARLESGAIGLEELVARLAEVLAMTETATSPQGTQPIDEIAEELEALQGGLAETEDMSRRVLMAYESGRG